jgi:hypothetical protein
VPLTVRSLHVYPVKGMRAVDLARARVEERGLEHDRRWLVVDAQGKFLTQRSHPALATINARPTARGLALSADGAPEISVERPSGDQRRKVVVWTSQVDAAAADPSADAWVSARLGDDAALVYMDARALRLKVSVWTAEPVPVSFADAFPVLVATTGSLAALNRDIEAHGGAAVPMTRFRPNLVVDCDEPWAEDHWTRLEIGGVALDLVKPSDRCIVTTTDQRTGARMGKEPLAALARLRRSTDPRIDGVLFAVNAVPRALGEISVGAHVAAARH